MAKNSDAASIKPRFIPNDELMARDDSGGPDWNPHTAQFGDGGFVVGEKAHLSARGGKDDPIEGTEQSDKTRTREYDRESKLPAANPGDTARAKKEAKE